MAAVANARKQEREGVIDCIVADYRELPLCLTAAQAARLWQLDVPRATVLLEQLVDRGILRRDDNRYVRAQAQRWFG